MADLDELNAALPVKLIGSDSLGVEQTPVKSTGAGDLASADIWNQSGAAVNLSVSTTALVAKVGTSPLVNRKGLMIYNNGTASVYYGFSSGVTSTTGFPVLRNTSIFLPVGANVSVYLIAASGTHDVRIVEVA